MDLLESDDDAITLRVRLPLNMDFTIDERHDPVAKLAENISQSLRIVNRLRPPSHE